MLLKWVINTTEIHCYYKITGKWYPNQSCVTIKANAKDGTKFFGSTRIYFVVGNIYLLLTAAKSKARVASGTSADSWTVYRFNASDNWIRVIGGIEWLS